MKAIPGIYGQNFDKLADQHYTGDITIVPQTDFTSTFKAITMPSKEDMKKYKLININHFCYFHL